MEARGLIVGRIKDEEKQHKDDKEDKFTIILVNTQEGRREVSKELTEDELRTILAENYGESESQIEERIKLANIERKVDDIGIALSKLIFRARQNFNIYVLIGENTSAIKQKHRSTFFGYVQRESLDSLCLNICKIYEKPEDYEITSIPQILKLLPTMSLFSRENFLNGLELLGMGKNKVHQIQNITEDKLIRRGVEALQNIRPKSTSSEPLRKLIEIRNEWIAHPQRLTVKGSSGPSLNDIEGLIKWSEQFLGFVYDSFLFCTDCNIEGNASTVRGSAKLIFRDIGIQI